MKIMAWAPIPQSWGILELIPHHLIPPPPPPSLLKKQTEITTFPIPNTSGIGNIGICTKKYPLSWTILGESSQYR